MALFSGRFQQIRNGAVQNDAIAPTEMAQDSAYGGLDRRSFEQRKQVERSRQTIRRYKDAAVTRIYKEHAQTTNETRFGDSTYQPNTPQSGAKSESVRITRSQMNANKIATPSVHRANFSEPKARGFDPFR